MLTPMPPPSVLRSFAHRQQCLPCGFVPGGQSVTRRMWMKAQDSPAPGATARHLGSIPPQPHDALTHSMRNPELSMVPNVAFDASRRQAPAFLRPESLQQLQVDPRPISSLFVISLQYQPRALRHCSSSRWPVVATPAPAATDGVQSLKEPQGRILLRLRMPDGCGGDLARTTTAAHPEGVCLLPPCMHSGM